MRTDGEKAHPPALHRGKLRGRAPGRPEGNLPPRRSVPPLLGKAPEATQGLLPQAVAQGDGSLIHYSILDFFGVRHRHDPTLPTSLLAQAYLGC